MKLTGVNIQYKLKQAISYKP